MSSIAYITDKQMIEYHRLNGNRNINFWRPTTLKSFMQFSEGDYLFFLAKGTEKGQLREKGIVGYGRLTKEKNLDFKTMWRTYKQKNGYDNKEELYEAIMKITKHHEMPEYLNCLELSNVMFFQTPIYLSELNIQLSKQVESYIYLDQDDILNFFNFV